MAGYIYITGQGADPGAGRPLNDPMFKPVPSLGACMPNLRRAVMEDDWIFVVSGKIERFPQYVIGGMQVEEKISALEAFRRFPDNRLSISEGGRLSGNIIVDRRGKKHELDTHPDDGLDRRIQNFIVGRNPLRFESKREVARARDETLTLLQSVKGKKGNRPIDVIGRMSKLSDLQVQKILDWMAGIKAVER